MRKYNIAFLAVVFCAMLVFTWLTPLCGDDYIYAFNDCSTVRPLNFYDIYQNMCQQRVCVTARVASHFLVQLFLMLPKTVFNITNALIFVSSLVLIKTYLVRSGNGDKNNEVICTLLMIVGFFLIWCFMPVFGQIYFWLDGAVNYGWAIALILTFLLPFYSNFISESYNPRLLFKILLGVEALLLGAYSENGSLASMGIALCLLVYSYCEKKHIPVFLVINLILAATGYLFLMSAPVLQIKTTEESNAVKYIIVFTGILLLFAILAILAMKKSKLFKIGPVMSATVLVVYFVLFYEDGFEKIITSPSANLPMISCIFFALFSWSVYKKIDYKILFLSYIMFLAGTCSIAVFAFAIYLPARSCGYFTVFLILSCMLLLQHLNFKTIKIFSISAAILFSISFVAGASDILSVGKQNSVRISKINTAHENNIKEVYLDKFDYKTKYSAQFGIEDIDVNPAECWVNRYMADYYYLDYIYAK